MKEKIIELMSVLKIVTLMRLAVAQADEFKKITDTSFDYTNGDDRIPETFRVLKQNSNFMEGLFNEKVIEQCRTEFDRLCDLPEDFKNVFGFFPVKNAKLYYNNVINKILDTLKASIFNGEIEDDFSLFKETLRDTFYPLKPAPKIQELWCPDCEKMLVDDDVNGTPVYICPDCGAYVLKSNTGEALGLLANNSTHTARNNAKKAIPRIIDLKGLTMYEVFRRISDIVGKRVRKPTDIESLTREEALKVVLWEQALRDKTSPVKITSYDDIFAALKDGARIKVIDSVNPHLTAGKIIIPSAVGEGAFLFNSKTECVKFLLPKKANYTFRGNIITVTHPSGAREKYKIYANPDN